MKPLLVTSLALMVYLLRPVSGGSLLAYFDGPTMLWIAVSTLAISRMGNNQPDGQRTNRTSTNPLAESSFSGASFSRSSFLSPNNPLQ